MASGHAGRRHAHRIGCHVGHGVLHIAMLRWRRALIVKSAKFVLVSLEIIVGVGPHLAIGTGLMGATMSET